LIAEITLFLLLEKALNAYINDRDYLSTRKQLLYLKPCKSMFSVCYQKQIYVNVKNCDKTSF